MEPRRRAHLRLPVYFAGSNPADVTVIVVPVGSQRNGVLARDITGAICSESVPTKRAFVDALDAHWPAVDEFRAAKAALRQPPNASLDSRIARATGRAGHTQAPEPDTGVRRTVARINGAERRGKNT